jgi:hypothetical protein
MRNVLHAKPISRFWLCSMANVHIWLGAKPETAYEFMGCVWLGARLAWGITGVE